MLAFGSKLPVFGIFVLFYMMDFFLELSALVNDSMSVYLCLVALLSEVLNLFTDKFHGFFFDGLLAVLLLFGLFDVIDLILERFNLIHNVQLFVFEIIEELDGSLFL